MSTPSASPTTAPATSQDRELTDLVAFILEEAKRAGATAAEAGASAENGLTVTARLGETETIEYNRDKGVGITVYLDQSKGSASTSDFSADAVRDTVRAALAIARYTSPDPCAGLADPERLARAIPDLDLYHPWELNAEQAIELALTCENAARELDVRITNSEGASVSSHQGYRVYGNSHGFLAGYASSRHSLTCAVIAEDASGMQRDYWYTAARASSGLENAVDVGRRAAQRTLRRLNARQLATCTAPVLFTSEIAVSLLGHLISALRGGALYRKASFLLDHLGKQIFPEFIRLHEQPHLPRALGSAPFDNEGVATQARDIVQGGILQGYVLDSYSARKLNMSTTGNAGGVHNLTLESGALGFDELVKKMDRGLVVTELLGMGVNTVTGDYSRGAAGFWVEGGTVQYPVEEITIAGNLKDMFRHLVAVGTDVETRGSTRTGSILIERMTIAGG